jgi:hypothetical protein
VPRSTAPIRDGGKVFEYERTLVASDCLSFADYRAQLRCYQGDPNYRVVYLETPGRVDIYIVAS